MPRIYPIIVLLIPTLFCHCKSDIRKQVIALQPLEQYDPQHLQFIQRELQAFYHVPIQLLKERSLPASFINTTKGTRYSADSIVKWLARTTPDSITKVVALTHQDIFITKREHGQIKEPESTYAVWGIFGYAQLPGRSCVVSDHRLQTTNSQRFHHRLRTVVIHEVGHTMGLPHCPEKNCIMNDANESIKTVDNSGNDYCNDCRNDL